MRVKRGMGHLKRRKNLLAQTKGYLWNRKKSIKMARTAIAKAGAHAYTDRRRKKRDFRALWNLKINAACRQNGLKYSQFIFLLKKNKIELDRKVLAALAEFEPKIFEAIIKEVI